LAILLSCQKLHKTFGIRPLFDGLSFGLFEGERTGLIGPNGAGKSTLLRILAGLDDDFEGTLSLRRGLRVGYLAQRDRFDESEGGLTVRAAVEASLADLGLEDWERDIRVEQGLEQAGFADAEQAVSSLSGGRRKRLAIVCQVAREPDLLLLDEPTNHLDLEGVLWLEGFLSDLSFPFLVVTHDRRFLQRVCNRIIELNRRYEDGHFSSKGNYADFLEKREELFQLQQTAEVKLANTVRGEIEWLRKGPKARTTKQTARIDRAGEQIAELAELKYRNAQGRATEIDFLGTERASKTLVRAKALAMSRGGRRLFGPLDLMLGPGDKLGLLGENGSGKSTLLKVLAGELAPDSGELKRAERLQVVTFDQHREGLDMEQSLQKALCPIGEHVEYKGQRIHVFGWAERFLFRKEQMHLPLRLLSGGEQSRVLIARLMRQSADLLLLDEPTNDLDLQSLEVLENSLRDFPGALVLVTHDRWLLDRVSGSILALDGKGGARFYAELSQWETWKESQPRGGDGAPAAAAPARALTPEQSKELGGLESKIRAAEEKLAAARSALADPAVSADAGELAKRHAKASDVQAKVDALYARWDELEALRAGRAG
jgi:ATP-binding cassette subfamily F protein uup